MDISSLKTLLEIQAIQSIGNADINTNSLTGNRSVFSELMEQLLLSSTSTISNSTETILSNSLLNSNFNRNVNSEATNYIDSFLYQSLNALPSTYYNQLINSNNYTTSFDAESITINNDSLKGANKYAHIISKAARKYGVPEKLITAVIKQESNFNPNAVSSAGATGLMQIMPGTARFLGVQNLKDPEQNIMGGTKYLSQLLKKYDQNIELALAAYNAGPGNVKKYGGIPPFKETIHYVKKVLGNYLA